MKRRVQKCFAVLPLALAAGAALAGVWTDPVKVNTQAVKDCNNVCAATRQGKLGIYYHQASTAGTWGRSSYNEFTYAAGTLGPLTHVITDEEVFYTYGVAGTRNLGMGYATNGQPVFGSIRIDDGNIAPARVIRRSVGGTYNFVNVSTTASINLSGQRDAFVMDAANHAHLVWASAAAAGTQQVLYATDSSGSWVTTVLASPDYPHTTANQGPKPVLALKTNGIRQVSFSAGTAAKPTWPSAFYHVDGSDVRDTGKTAGALNSTPGVRHDIEVAPNGDVLIAHLTTDRGGKITLTTYDGLSYTHGRGPG